MPWSVFVKAEKCKFHMPSISFLGFVVGQGQLSLDPAKVRAVADWPVPSSRKELQRFLGFANFYRPFVRNYSGVAAPLTALTNSLRPFIWTKEAQAAFACMKVLFSTAPILSHPDPALPFTVQVAASESAIGAVLSQRSAADQTLHPCAFFSRCLSPAERNYDEGNREFLALQEWRHWLEGSPQPFCRLDRP